MSLFEGLFKGFGESFWGQEVGEEAGVLIIGLIVLIAVILLILLLVALRYAGQKSSIRRRETMERDIASRRRIRVSDKNEVLERDNYTCQICGISKEYLDSLCEGLGDYLLLEVDHIQSVSQGGTGRNVDNLQCLCWRCNRKKGGNKTNEQVRAMIDYGMDFLEPDDENS